MPDKDVPTVDTANINRDSKKLRNYNFNYKGTRDFSRDEGNVKRAAAILKKIAKSSPNMNEVLNDASHHMHKKAQVALHILHQASTPGVTNNTTRQIALKALQHVGTTSEIAGKHTKGAQYLGDILKKRNAQGKAPGIARAGEAIGKAREEMDDNKVNQNASQVADEIKKPLQSKETPETSTPGGTTVSMNQPEQPQSISAEKATTTKSETPKVEEPKPEEEKVDLTNKVDPSVAVERIKKLRDSTNEEIDKIVTQLKSSNDPMAKLSLSKVLATQKHFSKMMNKHENNALAGPWNARKALNWAEADAYTAKNTAFKHTLKGSVRRGLTRAGETAESLKNRIKGIPGKIEKASAKSENAEKIRQAYSKAKERIKTGVESGVEKAGNAVQGAQEKREAQKNQKAETIKKAMTPQTPQESLRSKGMSGIQPSTGAVASTFQAPQAQSQGNLNDIIARRRMMAQQPAPQQAPQPNQQLALPAPPPMTAQNSPAVIPPPSSPLNLRRQKKRAKGQGQLPTQQQQKQLTSSPPQLESFDYNGARPALRKYVR